MPEPSGAGLSRQLHEAGLERNRLDPPSSLLANWMLTGPRVEQETHGQALANVLTQKVVKSSKTVVFQPVNCGVLCYSALDNKRGCTLIMR